MSGHANLERARDLNQREEASLRRLTAHLHAEADELPRDGWVAEHLDPRAGLVDCVERTLPELAALMADESARDSWTRRRSDPRSLDEDEEACLRRIAALLRAEAAELEDGSPLARRLDGWGIRLALTCEAPERSPRMV
jgi:hypothetical protein